MSSTHPRLESAALSAARDALSRHDLARADASYREHLAVAGRDPQALAEYGIFCLRSGRAAAARHLLGKALALQPGQAGWQVQLGYACIGVDAYAAARDHFQSAREGATERAQVHFGLALCHQHAGAWRETAAELAVALEHERNPRDAYPILLQLAQACQRTGDAVAAAIHFLRAAAQAPHDPAQLHAHACFLREQGQPGQAIALLDECLRYTPEEPRILLEMARCLRAQGRYAAALEWLDRLQRRAPGRADAYAERGYCLPDPADAAARERAWLNAIERWTQAGDYTAARNLLQTLQDAFPASVAGWIARGKLEQACGDDAAAIAAWQTAHARDPSHPEATACLALALERSNRLDEAEAVASAATAASAQAAAGAVELHLVRARLARRRKDAASAREQLDALDALPANLTQRMHAGYERGKLMDQIGDAPGAMAAFTSANRLALDAWQTEHPGRNKALAGVDYMLARVREGLLERWQPIADLPTQRELAFLVGFPRSGTTLLNQIFDGHPSIHAIEEKPTVQQLLDGVQAMPAGYPQALAALDAFDIGALRQAYFAEAARHGVSDPQRLLLDKFPMNANLAGLIHRVFPQARYVFALRHPCDVVLSCFMQDFTLNNTMANFCTLADTVALYTRTQDLWQAYREYLPLRVHTVRYEDVVDDFDRATGALCDFLDVPWREDLRGFSDRALARGRIDTPSYEQVSQPIYRQARFRWERYREFLDPFLPTLQPYIERFGYACR